MPGILAYHKKVKNEKAINVLVRKKTKIFDQMIFSILPTVLLLKFRHAAHCGAFPKTCATYVYQLLKVNISFGIQLHTFHRVYSLVTQVPSSSGSLSIFCLDSFIKQRKAGNKRNTFSVSKYVYANF